ncbi:MAG: hypothetical protein HQ526_04840 [Actinobacteria bacterium]|nr:hypothetical protein [Actinomycetota bacterium]
MSDLSSSPNDQSTIALERGKRPFIVVVLAVLVILGALVQFFAAAAAVFFAFRPGEAQQLFNASVSDWYWVMTAALSLVLGLIYLWISRGMLAGNAQAWMLVNVLAFINLFFAIFQIPVGSGWATLAISALLLLVNNTPAVRRWFRVYSTSS